MEVTFTPGLAESKPGDETTLEKYQRKMKEKRKKKKTESKPVEDTGAEADEFFDDDEGDVPAPSKKPSKGSKKHDTVSEDKPSRTLSTAEELSLLVSSDNRDAEPRHFDMKAILKAEKQAKRKGKKKKPAAGDEAANEMQEDFAIDVNDSRFQVLHEDHAFAIDPSNPQ
jgi:hypothetical protein